MNWTHKWRINVNIGKCEVCIFSEEKIDESNNDLRASIHHFKYNPKPKLPSTKAVVSLSEMISIGLEAYRIPLSILSQYIGLRRPNPCESIPERRKRVNEYQVRLYDIHN